MDDRGNSPSSSSSRSCRGCLGTPNLRALWGLLILNTSFATAQMIGAAFANSLSMFSDSGSMMIDSLTYAANIYTERRKEQLGGEQAALVEIRTTVFSIAALIMVTALMMNDSMKRLASQNHVISTTTTKIATPSANTTSPEQRQTVGGQYVLGFSLGNLVIDIVMCANYFYQRRRHVQFSRGTEEESKRGQVMKRKAKRARRGVRHRRLNQMARVAPESAVLLAPSSDARTGDQNGSDPSDAVEDRGDRDATGGTREETVETGEINMAGAFVHLFADTLRTCTGVIAGPLELNSAADSLTIDAVATMIVCFLILAAAAFVAVETFQQYRSLRFLASSSPLSDGLTRDDRGELEREEGEEEEDEVEEEAEPLAINDSAIRTRNATASAMKTTNHLVKHLEMTSVNNNIGPVHGLEVDDA